MRSHSNPRHWAFIAYAAFDCALLDGIIVADRASQALGSELQGISSAGDGASTDKLERYRATGKKNSLAVIAISSASTGSHRITRPTR